MGKVFEILERKPQQEPSREMVGQFQLGPPHETADDSVLHELGWAIYKFNFETKSVDFVDVGADGDMSDAPFSYTWQFEHAKRITTLSFENFVRLSNLILSDKKVVHLFNIGHCGSTLLHHVFNKARGVWCVSEPLFTHELAMERANLDRDTISDLAQAGLKFLALCPGANRAEVLIVKHFSQSTTLFHVFYKAHLQAVCLFLYRDCASWCNSLFGFVQRMGMPLQLNTGMRKFSWYMISANTPESYLDGLVDLESDSTTFEDLAVVGWALHIQHYIRAYSSGVPLWALRYNELNGDHSATVEKIFKHCSISISNLAEALAAFDQDSHQGAITSHDVPVLKFGPENYARINNMLSLPKLNLQSGLLLPTVS